MTQNGKAVANGTAKEVATSQIAPQPKPEVSTLAVSVLPKEKNVLPPIEARFLKLDDLHAIRLKWDKLKETQDKLNKFKLASDGKSDIITLADGRGSSFSTYNPDVITKVVDWLKEDISKKLKETEAQIILQ